MKILSRIAVFVALLSAGAWTCQAAVVLKHPGGGYYLDSYLVFEYMTEYLGHSVYSMEMYNQFSDGHYMYVYSGLMLYDAENKTIQIIGFQNNLADARTMIGQWNGSSVTLYYCLADGYFDNETYTLYSE